MAKTTKIQDWTGKIIGFVREYDNGDKDYMNFMQEVQAKYRRSLDVTTDFYGRRLEEGDAGRGYITND